MEQNAQSVVLAAASISVPVVAFVFAAVKQGVRCVFQDPTATLLVLASVGAALLIPHAFDLHPAFGAVFAVAAWGAALLMCEQFVSGSLPDWPWMSAYLISIFCVLAMVPMLILPHLRGERPDIGQQVAEASAHRLASVEESLNTIRRSLSTAEDSVNRERKAIDSAVRQLSEDLRKRSDELTNLEQKRIEYEKRIAALAHLKSLDEAQIIALTSELGRGKYIDYFVGLVLGVISTFIASFLGRYVTTR